MNNIKGSKNKHSKIKMLECKSSLNNNEENPNSQEIEIKLED